MVSEANRVRVGASAPNENSDLRPSPSQRYAPGPSLSRGAGEGLVGVEALILTPMSGVALRGRPAGAVGKSLDSERSE